MIYTRQDSIDWHRNWSEALKESAPRMTDDEQQACARLATVLLCGEQSAIQMFTAEIERNRQRGATAAVEDLISIERDELEHERALSSFRDFFPETDDQHFLKRRAQRFFASLGRSTSLAEHFIRIAQLDSAVCKIMQQVESAASKNLVSLRSIAHRIKLDEARHVSVSRRYASHLGYDRSLEASEHQAFKLALVEMLEPLRHSFEIVGVDSDRLFKQVAGS